MALENEPSGYLNINRAGIGVKIKGNAANRATKITNSTGSAIQLYDAGNITFENLTFDVNTASQVLTWQSAGSCRYVKFKDCTITSPNTGASCRFLYRNSVTDGTDVHRLEFENCDIYTAGLINPIYYINAGINETFLVTNCRFHTSGNSAIAYLSSNKGKIGIYDNDFVMNISTASAILVGENTNVPTNTSMVVDIRNNTFSYINGTFDHAILAGRGTDKIYCVNNTFHAPVIDDGNNMAIVIKSIASVVGNAYFAGNYMSSARPIYLKGAANCIVKYNTFVSNVSTWECLSVINPASDLLSTGNIITHNNFIGGDKTIKCYPSSGFDSAATSLKTCTLDNNRYFSSTDNWFVDDNTNYSFANKYTLWTNNYNDTYSKVVISPVIIINETPIVDNSTVN